MTDYSEYTFWLETSGGQPDSAAGPFFRIDDAGKKERSRPIERTIHAVYRKALGAPPIEGDFPQFGLDDCRAALPVRKNSPAPRSSSQFQVLAPTCPRKARGHIPNCLRNDRLK